MQHYLVFGQANGHALNDTIFPSFADPVEGPSRMTSSHTDCHFCLQSLRGRKYALREENAYCVPCYDSLYANPCEECKQPIECNSKVKVELLFLVKSCTNPISLMADLISTSLHIPLLLKRPKHSCCTHSRVKQCYFP